MSDRPGPGLHRAFPEDAYHRLPYLSRSQLVEMRRSPAHCWAARKKPGEPTPAMILGRAIHTALLEPEVYSERFAVRPPEITRAGTKAHTAWVDDELGDRTELTHRDDATAMAIATKALSEPSTSALLECEGETELTVIWDDAETGVRLRARLDRFIEGAMGGVILDPKSTVDASPDGFQGALGRYNYHWQAAVYMDGMKACGVDVRSFAFMAFEKVEPYASAIYLLDEESIEQGRTEYRIALRRFAECERTGHWPGYGTNPITIGLPHWRQLKAKGGIVPFGRPSVEARTWEVSP